MIGQQKQIDIKAIQNSLSQINFTKISKPHNIQIQYLLIEMLNHIIIYSPQLTKTTIFIAMFNYVNECQHITSLQNISLYQVVCYKLWNSQHFESQIRQKTPFYKIVSNWIIHFQLKSGDLQSIIGQFQFIKIFMMKQTTTFLERLVLIEEIYEDLKELIDGQFWQAQQNAKFQILNTENKLSLQSINKEKKYQDKVYKQFSQNNIQQTYLIMEILNSLILPLYYKSGTSSKVYKSDAYKDIVLINVRSFISKSIYYLFSCRNMPTFLQNQITKIALIHLQYYQQHQVQDIVNLTKYLMRSTSKAVKYALIIEYVQFYEYLQAIEYDEVIEQLQKIAQFRQLIINKTMVTQTIQQKNRSINTLNLSYHELYIKAGTSKKIYFYNEYDESILKLDLLIQQNDINLTIFHYEISQIKYENHDLHAYVMQTVKRLNSESEEGQIERCYWKQEKSTSKRLQLLLKLRGLYSIQFNNNYSWIIPKNIKYRAQIFTKFN